MKNTLILVTTHRGLSDETYESIIATGCSSIVKVKGLACIDRARSIAFDTALKAFDAAPELNTLLCIDDDMVFTPTDAQRLVDASRGEGIGPIAARAVNSRGELAARPYPSVIHSDMWVTGLAFIAIPRARLVSLAATLPTIGGIRAWCRTGEHPRFPNEWIGEDYWLTASLGGVRLAEEINVGHLKTVALRPR